MKIERSWWQKIKKNSKQCVSLLCDFSPFVQSTIAVKMETCRHFEMLLFCTENWRGDSKITLRNPRVVNTVKQGDDDRRRHDGLTTL